MDKITLLENKKININEKEFIDFEKNIKKSNFFLKKMSIVICFHFNKKRIKNLKIISRNINDYKFYRNCKNVGHIEDLIIDEKFRGNGYSKLIVKELIEFGKEKECYKIILNCKDHYVGFYQKMGFKLNDNTMDLRI